MEMVIRDMVIEDDSPSVLQIINQFNNEPISLETFKNNHNTYNHSPIIKRVVLELNKRIIGFGFVVSETPNIPPGFLFEKIFVDKHYQSQGFGRIIESVLWSSVIDAKPLGIQSIINEGDLKSKKWAEKYAFIVKEVQFESVLDLSTHSLTRIEDKLNQHEKNGLTFKTMKHYPGDEHFELLCELFRTLLKDSPDCNGTEMGKDMAVSLLKTFKEENIILAIIDNRWIGMTVLFNRNKNEIYNFFTGTIEEMRGNGIATALKLKAISKSIPMGYIRMRTNNLSTNYPMLSVNKKLGFVQHPGKLILTKQLVWS
ncbi:GNAT family N-acetyltransferase [Neobacillus sp. YX16]|uniref:GNAT family N-acetyltransferase n=1 Tax=Neobacillus sp. YX16 TaxID=3047874 RepID=UPI0024C3E2B7|nr:GNAT family N-acetyltransferase [Neobacillus sp. YX16]WHZ04039.1 GNAT family N-acetyltransferase [Neobacillus sp. YX16]